MGGGQGWVVPEIGFEPSRERKDEGGPNARMREKRGGSTVFVRARARACSSPRVSAGVFQFSGDKM